jgi:hypothetical protein
MKADANRIREVIDTMYAEFMKQEGKKNDVALGSVPDKKSHPQRRPLCWIIGASVAVLVLLSVAVAMFFVLPLVHAVPDTDRPSTPTSPALPPQTTFPSVDQYSITLLEEKIGLEKRYHQFQSASGPA